MNHLLTDSFDDIRQQYTIRNILLKVRYIAFIASFLEVMIGPICVNLQKRKKLLFQD